MAYDIEYFLGDLTTTLQASLNAAITAINTEKNDSITMDTVLSTSYAFMELPDHSNLKSPWIVVGHEPSIISETCGAGAKSTVRAFIALGHEGLMSYSTEKLNRIFMRYNRAIRQTILSNFSVIGHFSLLKIEELGFPLQFENKRGETVNVAGVIVTAVLT